MGFGARMDRVDASMKRTAVTMSCLVFLADEARTTGVRSSALREDNSDGIRIAELLLSELEYTLSKYL